MLGSVLAGVRVAVSKLSSPEAVLVCIVFWLLWTIFLIQVVSEDSQRSSQRMLEESEAFGSIGHVEDIHPPSAKLEKQKSAPKRGNAYGVKGTCI